MKKVLSFCVGCVIAAIAVAFLWKSYVTPERLARWERNRINTKAMDFAQQLRDKPLKDALLVTRDGQMYLFVKKSRSDEIVLFAGNQEVTYRISDFSCKIWKIYYPEVGGRTGSERAGLLRLFQKGITIVDIKRLDEVSEPILSSYL